MRILLIGGGSGGPVSPLIAVAQEIKKTHPKAEFLLVGTKSGPERRMSEAAKIPFVFITSGKWRRYFAWPNFLTPFQVLAGFFQAVKILKSFKPDCILAAGSFVQVPVVWAGKIMGIPVVLHQQDVLPGLATRLCQLAANKITVTFEASYTSFASTVGFFYKKPKEEKIILTGNPFREEFKNGSKQKAITTFNLKPDLPTLLVLGGGTGAEFFNEIIFECLPQLTKSLQIIHLTGKGKRVPTGNDENYHVFEFLDNMADAYAAADLVLCRAGLSTLTELSNLRKFSIVVPLPGTHQEMNAALLLQLEAAVVLRQDRISAQGLTRMLRKLIFAHEAAETIKHNIGLIMPHNAAKKIADIVIKLSEQAK